MDDVQAYNNYDEILLFIDFSKKISAMEKNLPKDIAMGTKRCQGKSCYGLASCSTWSVCVSVCICETSFMYVCETIFMYVCETIFMYVCDYHFIK